MNTFSSVQSPKPGSPLDEPMYDEPQHSSSSAHTRGSPSRGSEQSSRSSSATAFRHNPYGRKAVLVSTGNSHSGPMAAATGAAALAPATGADAYGYAAAAAPQTMTMASGSRSSSRGSQPNAHSRPLSRGGMLAPGGGPGAGGAVLPGVTFATGAAYGAGFGGNGSSPVPGVGGDGSCEGDYHSVSGGDDDFQPCVEGSNDNSFSSVGSPMMPPANTFHQRQYPPQHQLPPPQGSMSPAGDGKYYNATGGAMNAAVRMSGSPAPPHLPAPGSMLNVQTTPHMAALQHPPHPPSGHPMATRSSNANGPFHGATGPAGLPQPLGGHSSASPIVPDICPDMGGEDYAGVGSGSPLTRSSSFSATGAAGGGVHSTRSSQSSRMRSHNPYSGGGVVAQAPGATNAPTFAGNGMPSYPHGQDQVVMDEPAMYDHPSQQQQQQQQDAAATLYQPYVHMRTHSTGSKGSAHHSHSHGAPHPQPVHTTHQQQQHQHQHVRASAELMRTHSPASPSTGSLRVAETSYDASERDRTPHSVRAMHSDMLLAAEQFSSGATSPPEHVLPPQQQYTAVTRTTITTTPRPQSTPVPMNGTTPVGNSIATVRTQTQQRGVGMAQPPHHHHYHQQQQQQSTAAAAAADVVPSSQAVSRPSDIMQASDHSGGTGKELMSRSGSSGEGDGHQLSWPIRGLPSPSALTDNTANATHSDSGELLTPGKHGRSAPSSSDTEPTATASTTVRAQADLVVVPARAPELLQQQRPPPPQGKDDKGSSDPASTNSTPPPPSTAAAAMGHSVPQSAGARTVTTNRSTPVPAADGAATAVAAAAAVAAGAGGKAADSKKRRKRRAKRQHPFDRMDDLPPPTKLAYLPPPPPPLHMTTLPDGKGGLTAPPLPVPSHHHSAGGAAAAQTGRGCVPFDRYCGMLLRWYERAVSAEHDYVRGDSIHPESGALNAEVLMPCPRKEYYVGADFIRTDDDNGNNDTAKSKAVAAKEREDEDDANSECGATRPAIGSVKGADPTAVARWATDLARWWQSYVYPYSQHPRGTQVLPPALAQAVAVAAATANATAASSLTSPSQPYHRQHAYQQQQQYNGMAHGELWGGYGGAAGSAMPPPPLSATAMQQQQQMAAAAAGGAPAHPMYAPLPPHGMEMAAAAGGPPPPTYSESITSPYYPSGSTAAAAAAAAAMNASATNAAMMASTSSFTGGVGGGGSYTGMMSYTDQAAAVAYYAQQQQQQYASSYQSATAMMNAGAAGYGPGAGEAFPQYGAMNGGGGRNGGNSAGEQAAAAAAAAMYAQQQQMGYMGGSTSSMLSAQQQFQQQQQQKQYYNNYNAAMAASSSPAGMPTSRW